MRQSHHKLAIVTLILLLAAAARIINAHHAPLWTDEGASLLFVSDPHLDKVLDHMSKDFHPPLYFVLLSGWQQLSGDSRIGLRLLAILSDLIAVAVVYRIGRNTFGHQTAVYATLFYAVSDIIIQYAQQVRHYGWLVFAILIMSWMFLRFIKQPTWKRAIIYGLSVSFMLYSHYLGLMILAIQGLFGIFLWGGTLREKGRLVSAWVIALITYIPWLVALQHIFILLTEGGLGNRPHISQTTPESIVMVANLLANNQTAMIFGAFFVTAILMLQTRTRDTQWLSRFYIVACGGGLFGAILIVNNWLPMITSRTIVFLAPCLFIAAGYGLTKVPDLPRRLMIVVFTLITLATTDLIQPRIDIPAVSRVLANGVTNNDVVILETGYDDNSFNFEIRQHLPEDVEIIRTLQWTSLGEGVEPVVPRLEPTFNQHDRIWIVQWYQAPQVLNYLKDGNSYYQPAIYEDVHVGAEYHDLFYDNDVTVAMFERVDPAVIAHEFDDIFALHRAFIPPTHPRANPELFVDLWWSRNAYPTLDYSVGVYLMDADGVVRAESNAPPSDTPTTQWKADTLYFDRHTLTLPADLPAGDYQIAAKVYWYGDLVPLPVDGDEIAILGTLTLK